MSGKFHILLFSFFYVFPYSYLTEECWSLERSAPSLKSHLNIYQELQTGHVTQGTDTQNMNILVGRTNMMPTEIYLEYFYYDDFDFRLLNDNIIKENYDIIFGS